MSFGEGFLWGILGGLFAELLGWHKLRQIDFGDYPAWTKTRSYWLITFAMIIAGGALVDMYIRSGATLNSIVAVNLGASAPLVLGTFASQTPHISPSRRID